MFQSKGGSLYLGSSASNLRLVFYEKGYEQNKKYGTEYLETLKVYLATQCDVQDSADLLHIHRNSFCYRLRKIEELLGMELKDNKVLEELMFAFKCLQ